MTQQPRCSLLAGAAEANSSSEHGHPDDFNLRNPSSLEGDMTRGKRAVTARESIEYIFVGVKRDAKDQRQLYWTPPRVATE